MFDSSYFLGGSNFENNGMQNYLLALSAFTKDFKPLVLKAIKS